MPEVTYTPSLPILQAVLQYFVIDLMRRPFRKKDGADVNFNLTFRQMNQISSAYSAMVRSEENLPELQMFIQHLRAKPMRSL